MELISGSAIETCNLSEVLRSIHVALLCVQESREARPNMSYVVLMLGNKDALAQPKHPGFFIERDTIEASSTKQSKPSLANDCSSSVLDGCDGVYPETLVLMLCGEAMKMHFPSQNHHVFGWLKQILYQDRNHNVRSMNSVSQYPRQ
ncbi:unnamed protein product [Dovyalis caffra]|uniref:S-locus receptor kinase C-terminal domain-containing protein n=1 Tax=Dovyalis caffra TaxID=77055 RepID=A0AAV1R3T6_9ROSI|nr:unnamed protein product [Dovyalis caffra]